MDRGEVGRERRGKRSGNFTDGYDGMPGRTYACGGNEERDALGLARAGSEDGVGQGESGQEGGGKAMRERLGEGQWGGEERRRGKWRGDFTDGSDVTPG